MTIQDMIERLKDALGLAEAIGGNYSKDGNVSKMNDLDTMIVQLEDTISDLEEMAALGSPMDDLLKKKAFYNNCIKKISQLLIETYENLPDPWVLEKDIIDELESLKIHTQKFKPFTDELFAESDVKFLKEAVGKQSELIAKEKQFQCLQYLIPDTKKYSDYLNKHTQIDNYSSYIQKIDEVEDKLRACELSSDKAYNQINLIQQSIFLAAIKAMKTANTKDTSFINRLNSLESKIKTSKETFVNYVDVIKAVQEHQKPVDGTKKLMMELPIPPKLKRRAKVTVIVDKNDSVGDTDSLKTPVSSDSSGFMVEMVELNEEFDRENTVNDHEIQTSKNEVLDEQIQRYPTNFIEGQGESGEFLEHPNEKPGMDLLTLITTKQTLLNKIASLDVDLREKMLKLRNIASQPNIELAMDISAIIPLPAKIQSLIENIEQKEADTNTGQEHSSSLDDLEFDRLENIVEVKKNFYDELLKTESDVYECLANEIRKIEINRACIVHNNGINRLINNFLSGEIGCITSDLNVKLTTIRDKCISDLNKDLSALELDKVLETSLQDMRTLFVDAKVQLKKEFTRIKKEEEQKIKEEARQKEQFDSQIQRKASPECQAVQKVIERLRTEIQSICTDDPSDLRTGLLRDITNQFMNINTDYIYSSNQHVSDFYEKITDCLKTNLSQDKISQLSPHSALASAFIRFINWAFLPLRQLFSKNVYQAGFFASKTEKAVAKAAQEALTTLTTIQDDVTSQLNKDGMNPPLSNPA